MSKALSFDEILFRQRLLSCCGFYKDTLDGLWGKHTDEAEQAFAARSKAIAAAEGSFDARSETNIASLRCDAQEAARRSLNRIRATGIDARIISGTRTYPEQTALYRQGRFGNPPPKVTNAKAGQSWHNFGLAWDIGLFAAGHYETGTAPYLKVAKAAKDATIEWGGDWVSFQDVPHYQLATHGQSVAAARAFFEAGGRG